MKHTKQVLLYAISFFLLVAVLIIDEKTNSDMKEYDEKVEHTRIVITSLHKLSDQLKSAEIYTPGHAKTYRPIYQLYLAESDSIPKQLADLKALVSDNAQQETRIDTLTSIINRHLPFLLKKNIAELISSGEAWRLNNIFEIHQLINESIELEDTLLKFRKDRLNQSSRYNQIFTAAFTIIAFSLIVATFFYNVVLMRKSSWLQGFLESILNTSQNGIIHFKAVRRLGKVHDFKLSFANKTVQDQLNKSSARLLDANLGDLGLVNKNTDDYNKMLKVTETGEPQQFEMLYKHNNNDTWFYVMLAKMEDGFTATFQNITQIKHYQDELNRNIAKLEASNKELEQYAFAASHDMQEPLRKIRTYANMLQTDADETLNEKGKLYLSKITQSAERLTILIKDILNFSSLKKVVTYEPTDLNFILANVIEDIDLAIAQKKAVIVHATLPKIEAIPLQIHQLFFNLLTNALKFGRPDVALVIKINSRTLSEEEVAEKSNLQPNKSYCEITFADNGIGFNSEFKLLIFGLFKKLNETSAYPGSGIGLALCSKVVANHQGEIYATAQEGQGATFHIILPVQQ